MLGIPKWFLAEGVNLKKDEREQYSQLKKVLVRKEGNKIKATTTNFHSMLEVEAELPDTKFLVEQKKIKYKVENNALNVIKYDVVAEKISWIDNGIKLTAGTFPVTNYPNTDAVLEAHTKEEEKEVSIYDIDLLLELLNSMKKMGTKTIRITNYSATKPAKIEGSSFSTYIPGYKVTGLIMPCLE